MTGTSRDSAPLLMVICGAGASWDSVNFPVTPDVNEYRPPMGPDLFANRSHFGGYIDRYGPIRPLVHRFRGVDGSVSLEAELERLQDASKDRVQLRRQLTALRYYLHQVIVSSTKAWSDALRGVTNYVRLVDEIDALWTERRGASVVYITFNYDTMLDGALGQLGIRMGQDLDSYLADPRYKLIKPHGSVNWFHSVTGFNSNHHPFAPQIIENIDSMTVSSGFFTRTEHVDIGELGAIPALAMPVARKTQFEAPREHIDAARDSMPLVTHLLVIGWRGNEEYFSSMMAGIDRKRLVSLVVSRGLNSATRVAKALALPAEPPAVSSGGFSDLLRGTELTEFLAR